MSQYTKKITAMREGGKRLAVVKQSLADLVQPGISFEEIEAHAQRLIKEQGCVPSFSTVKGYSWATCLMRNDEMCHGIPKGKRAEAGDVLKIDVGLIFDGYHLDTTTTVAVGTVSSEIQDFLKVGQKSLAQAIKQAKAGNSVYDISNAMEKVVTGAGYSCVYQLCGHGISTQLHEEPEISCIAYRRDKKVKLYDGQTIAVEIMYAMGSAALIIDDDGWTYKTADGSMAAMFEETVLVTKQGPEILTQSEA
jgi:methionyl aminopeptidase